MLSLHCPSLNILLIMYFAAAPDEELGRERRSSSLEKSKESSDVVPRPRSASMEDHMHSPCGFTVFSLNCFHQMFELICGF